MPSTSRPHHHRLALSAIEVAIEENDHQALEALLRPDPSVAVQPFCDGPQFSPLMWAAHLGHLDCLQVLLPHSHPQAVDEQGMSALMIAARARHPACVHALLPHSHAQHCTANGTSALMIAAQAGSVACVLALLPHSKASQVDTLGFNALMMAAYCGHADCVRALVAHCDPNVIVHRDTSVRRHPSSQKTALMIAIESGSLPTVQALLGVSDLRVTVNQYTLLMLAAATRKSNPSITQTLLPLMDVHARGPQGFTVLMCAARGGHVAQIELLLNPPLGLVASDPHAQDDAGNTALMHAIDQQTAQAVEVLLGVCDLRTLNHSGDDAAQLAWNKIPPAAAQNPDETLDVALIIWHLFVPFLPLDRLQEALIQDHWSTAQQRAQVIARIEWLQLQACLSAPTAPSKEVPHRAPDGLSQGHPLDSLNRANAQALAGASTAAESTAVESMHAKAVAETHEEASAVANTPTKAQAPINVQDHQTGLFPLQPLPMPAPSTLPCAPSPLPESRSPRRL